MFREEKTFEILWKELHIKFETNYERWSPQCETINETLSIVLFERIANDERSRSEQKWTMRCIASPKLSRLQMRYRRGENLQAREREK